MKTLVAEDKDKAAKSQTNRAAALAINDILVPLDFSRASMCALKYTIALADEFGATVHLVHVQPTDELTSIAESSHLMLNCADAIALMQDRLAEIQEKHAAKFWPEHCHVVSGRPYVEIAKLARELKVDLIVLPTRGHSGLKRLALGSTAERLVRISPCPVLIPRGPKFDATTWSGEPADEFSLESIIVPIDFSGCSMAGLRYAAKLARRCNAKLRLIHVIYPYLQLFQLNRASSDVAPLIESARRNAAKEMQEIQLLDFMEGIPSETEILIGPAIDQICAQSADPTTDLLVIATHGRTGLEHAMIGSVAEHVVRYAESPVLVIPCPSHARKNVH